MAAHHRALAIAGLLNRPAATADELEGDETFGLDADARGLTFPFTDMRPRLAAQCGEQVAASTLG